MHWFVHYIDSRIGSFFIGGLRFSIYASFPRARHVHVLRQYLDALQLSFMHSSV